MTLDELLDALRQRGTMTEEDSLAILEGELLDPDEVDPAQMAQLYGVKRWWGPLVITEVRPAGTNWLGHPELVVLANLESKPSWECVVSVPGELIGAAERSFTPGLSLPLYGYLVRGDGKFWGRGYGLPTLRISRHPQGEPPPRGHQDPTKSQE